MLSHPGGEYPGIARPETKADQLDRLTANVIGKAWQSQGYQDYRVTTV